MINEQSYQILGMKQDNLIATGNSSKFAHEIMNMRFNTIGDYTTASWTTEKGTKKVDVDESDSTWEYYKSITSVVELAELSPIGQCNINDTWIIFGKFSNEEASKQDVIIQFKLEEIDNNYKLVLKLLYYGNLNFDTKHPIEALGYYESDKIQKVYWVDGINQQRVINISNVKYAFGKDTQFDFVPSVCLNEEVTVEKLSNGTGLFPPGTVKYAITYLYEYGQESNIIWTSPLYYPTIGNRACSPDELSGDSFKITVDYIDTSHPDTIGRDNEHGFDIIRLYSIIRTSDNATPIVRIVDEKRINDLPKVSLRKQAVFIDTNTTGEIIDPSKLNFIGGKPFIAQTLSQKDNTLFLGNLTLKTSSAKAVINSDENIKNIFNASKDSVNTDFKYYSTFDTSPTNSIEDKTVQLYDNTDSSAYQYIPQTTESSRTIKTFKYGEEYRFGIQFQDSYGIWSDVLHIRDRENDKKPEHINTGYRLARFEYTLPSKVAKAFKEEGFKKARLVCCYPNNADRNIIAQGVLNPTVSNTKDEETHSPDFSASWFFRPYIYKNNEYEQLNYIDGPSTEIQACKIEFNEEDPTVINSYYAINSNKFTFNSPEIDFDDSIKTLPSDGFEIRIVGYIPIQAYTNSVYIDASSPLTNVAGNKGIGLVNSLTVQNRTNNLTNYIDLSEAAWRDYDNYYRTGEGGAGSLYNYEIYPFQRKGSLNNYIKDINNWKAHYINGGTTAASAKYETYSIKETAKLNSKVYSHLAYSLYSDYSDNIQTLTLKELNLVSDSNPLPTKLGQDIYMGSLDTILPMWVKGSLLSGSISNGADDTDDEVTLGSIKGFYYIWYDSNFVYPQAGNSFNNIPVATDPIPITYKTLPHIVFSLYNDIEPQDYSIGYSHPPYLYLAEIYRNKDTIKTKFGGDAETAFNAFVPCGDAVSLTNNSVTLLGKEGDTYLQRYDCLKTVPLRADDTNQIVEILSFACETRINLDGRYDRNRGLYDNTTINETNFNLINKSYTQTDNLFTYFILSDLDSTLDVFPNQFTWSLPKVVSDTVDTWTNISLESTADADGIYGKINKIVNNNSRLILFQDHAISQIGFNESTAIPTETGIPLELAKTGKFTGLNYLTTEIGCQNKWSISSTKNGIFFIDDSRQELLTLSEGFTSLSTMHGFDAFMINQLPTTFKTWNPIEFDNFITYYDKLSNDVYYINKNVCLAWNEQTKTFTSFYNYESVPYMMNIGQHNFLLKNGIYAAREDDAYSKFFDEVKDYWITITCDGQTDRGSAFPADKVFNNVEYRADIYNLDGNNTNYSTSIFNKKQAWNGYQNSNECSLDGIRKFNTWRIQLPRHAGTRDRIRSPFCYIKLKQDQSRKQQTDRAILHDLAVYFDMR